MSNKNSDQRLTRSQAKGLGIDPACPKTDDKSTKGITYNLNVLSKLKVVHTPPGKSPEPELPVQ